MEVEVEVMALDQVILEVQELVVEAVHTMYLEGLEMILQ